MAAAQAMTGVQEPENALFARWRDAGDRSALAELFDRTAPDLLRTARHLLVEPGDAEDAVQRTFLTALEDADQFDDTRPIAGWLTGILTNVARSEFRRRRRSRATSEELETVASAAHEEPSETAARREISQTVLTAIDNLDALHRAPVVLRVAYGMAPAEIAHALDRSPGTVRTQLHRGIERVRRALPPSARAGVASLAVAALPTIESVRSAVLAAALPSAKGLAVGAVVGGTGLGLRAFGLSLLLLVGLLVWLATFDRSGNEPSRSMAPPEVEVASTAADRPETAAATPAGAGPRTERALATPTDTPAPEPEQVLVHVVRGGAPVEGVEVFYGKLESARDRPTDIATFLHQHGVRAGSTDAQGHARIPVRKLGTRMFDFNTTPWAPAPHRAIVALAPGEVGVGVLADDSTREVEIELTARRQFAVEVLDHHRRPAAEVGLSITWQDAGRPARYPLGRTDASGLLVVPSGRILPGIDGQVDARLEVDVCGLDLSEPLRPDTPDTLQIVLPPTGSVELLLDPAAGLSDRSVAVDVRLAGDSPASRYDRFELQPGTAAVIPHVGLGATLVLQPSFRLAGSTRHERPPEFEHHGPTDPDQRTVCAIRLELPPTVAGRIVDADRAPVASSEIILYLHLSDGGTQAVSTTTDAEGRFEREISPDRLGAEIEAVRVLDVAGGRGHLSTATHRLAGRVDLGDLIVDQLPLFASGELVDPAGEPFLEDVHFNTSTIPYDGVRTWRSVDGGHFVVRGFEDHAQSVQIRVSKHRFMDIGPLFVEPGTTDLRLVMRRGHDLAIEFPFEGLDEKRTEVPPFVLVGPEPSNDQRSCGSNAKDGQARCWWTKLEPGSYDLVGRFPGHTTPWLVLPDLEIGSDRVDPRLAEIRLPNDLRTLRIELLDDVTTCNLFVAPPDGSRPPDRISVYGTAPELIYTGQPLDVLVERNGHAPVLLRGIRSDQQVRFERSIAFDVAVRGPTAGSLVVRVRQLDGSGQDEGTFPTPAPTSPSTDRSSTTIQLSNGPNGRLFAPRAGSYAIDVFYLDDRTREPRRVDGFHPTTVEIPSVGLADALTIDVPEPSGR